MRERGLGAATHDGHCGRRGRTRRGRTGARAPAGAALARSANGIEMQSQPATHDVLVAKKTKRQKAAAKRKAKLAKYIKSHPGALKSLKGKKLTLKQKLKAKAALEEARQEEKEEDSGGGTSGPEEGQAEEGWCGSTRREGQEEQERREGPPARHDRLPRDPSPGPLAVRGGRLGLVHNGLSAHAARAVAATPAAHTRDHSDESQSLTVDSDYAGVATTSNVFSAR